MPYGYWIAPTGEEIPVEDRLGHARIVPYEDAYSGYIAVVDQSETKDRYGRDHHFSARIYENVTEVALVRLRRMIQRSDKPWFSFEVMGFTAPPYIHPRADLGASEHKRSAIAWVNDLINKIKTGEVRVSYDFT